MTILNKTKFLEFKSAKSPSDSDWYYVKRTNDNSKHDSAVVITTIVKKQNQNYYLFLKTLRPPIYAENKAKYCLESPAGLIADENSNENLIECANKELLEETGLKADNIYIDLLNSSTSAGLSSETLSYVTAICNEYNIIQKPVSDGGIIYDRLLISCNEIYDYINNLDTKLISVAAATICGIFFAQKHLL